MHQFQYILNSFGKSMIFLQFYRLLPTLITLAPLPTSMVISIGLTMVIVCKTMVIITMSVTMTMSHTMAFFNKKILSIKIYTNYIIKYLSWLTDWSSSSFSFSEPDASSSSPPLLIKLSSEGYMLRISS